MQTIAKVPEDMLDSAEDLGGSGQACTGLPAPVGGLCLPEQVGVSWVSEGAGEGQNRGGQGM